MGLMATVKAKRSRRCAGD